ncbi:hypothetical protein T440DRAFT_484538, partial [Plenodomus tracheiphilus IPT5]
MSSQDLTIRKLYGDDTISTEEGLIRMAAIIVSRNNREVLNHHITSVVQVPVDEILLRPSRIPMLNALALELQQQCITIHGLVDDPLLTEVIRGVSKDLYTTSETTGYSSFSFRQNEIEGLFSAASGIITGRSTHAVADMIPESRADVNYCGRF